MQELSLNVLDIVQNSISAKATLIEVSVCSETEGRLLTITVADNGCGMTPEQVKNVTDPFYTSRKTRRVGLGVPFFKMAAEMTGGSFEIASQPGSGTKLRATFRTDSIDCMPLGDINETVYTLVTLNEQIDFVYTRRIDERMFTLDTRELRAILGDIPFSEPEIAAFIREYIASNAPAGTEA